MADHHSYLEESLLRELSRSRVNALYHTERRRFYVTAWRFLTVASLVSFSVAVVGFVGELKELYPKYIAAASALTFVVDLLFSPALSASHHAVLARRYVSLEKSINRNLALEHDSAKLKLVLAEILSDRLEIEIEEPPTMRWLWIWAFNQVAVSDGSAKTYEIPLLQRLLKHWIDVLPVEGLDKQTK